MATAGTLNLVLGADSTQLRQELGKVRQESQATALAITNLFSGDTINAVGFRVLRGTITGVIADLDRFNDGLSITDSLVNNLTASFGDLGDVALLQLGQIAQFLGDDLFQTPLAGLQSASLERSGLGQLEGAFQIVTAGSNAAKVLDFALSGLTTSFEVLDAALGSFQAKAQSVADFFLTIGQSAELVSDILKTTANLIDGAIDQVLDSLQATYPAIGLIREGAKALGIEFSVGKSILGDWIDQLDRIEGAANGAAEAALDISSAAGDARRGINQADEAIDEFGANLNAQRTAAAGFESAMKDLADAAVLFDQWKQISDIVDGALGSFEQNFQAASAAQNLENRLNLVSTAAGGAREDLQFLTETADELGVDFNAAAQGFTQFSTAASLTNLTTTQTKDIFEAITQSTAVMGLSVADTQGTFLALQQILSSGNVQLEELNQIAERVPGTFQAAAAALGVTTSELKGLISTGTVDSEEFLIGFAQQLESFTDAGVVDAMDSATASVNRFNNALGQFQIAAGQAWVEIGAPALNIFANALEFAAKNEELFSTAIDAVLVASLYMYRAGIKKALVATYQFITANKTAAVSLFGKQLKFTITELGKYAATIAIAYAGVIVFFRTLDRFKDSAKSTRAAIKSLDRSIAELNETAEDANLENIIPQRPAARDWLDVPVTLMKRIEEEGSAVEKLFVNLNKATFAGVAGELNKFVTYLKTGNYELTTFADKAANDALAAFGDFAVRADEILGRSINLRERTVLGEGPIKEVERLDAALKQLENRKLGLNPEDEEAVAAILREEQELLERRSKAQKEILANQSALNNLIAQTKQEIQNLDQTVDPNTEEYQKLKAQYEARLTQFEKEKQKLDEVATVAVETTQTIADAYKQTNKEIESSYSDRTATIAEALAAGQITEEEARQRSLAAEKEYLAQKLANNKSALDELKTALEQDAKLRAAVPTAAGLLSADQLQEYKQQLEQLEQETSQTRIDLANTVREEKKQILERELADLEEANARAVSEDKIAANNRIAAIRQQQLAGAVSAEEAERQIQQVRQDGIRNEISQLQERSSQIDDLIARGVLSEQEGAAQKRDIQEQLSESQLSLIEAQAQAEEKARQQAEQAQEEAARKRLDQVERANQQAEQAIKQSQQRRVTAVREAQLAGVVSEAEAQRQLQQIQAESINESIAAKQREIDAVNTLRQEGILSAEEAADREADLIDEIGQLNQQRIEQELQAQERLREEYFNTLELQRTMKLEAQAEQLGMQTVTTQSGERSLQAELNLQSAFIALETSRRDLSLERLNTQIEIAKASGDEEKAARLTEEYRRREADWGEAIFQDKLYELELTQKLKDAESQRQIVQANIAAVEAEINLQRAQAEGASQLELQNLTQILELRQQAVRQAEDLRSAQQEINQWERESLENQQRINQERQRQAEIQAEAQRQQQQQAASDAGTQPSGNGTNIGRSETRQDGEIQYTTYSTRSSESEDESFDPATQYRGVDGRILNRRINASTSTGLTARSLLDGAIPSNSPLRSSGLSAAATVSDKTSVTQAIATGNQQVVQRLDKLEAAILQLANSPRSLTVQAPDPIRDMGNLLQTVSAQKTKAARL